MKYRITPELLHKYIDGYCTPEEILAINQWYDSFEGDNDPFVNLNVREQQALKKLMFSRFTASVQAAGSETEFAGQKRSFNYHLIYALTAVAAVCLLVLAFYFNRGNTVNNLNAAISQPVADIVLSNQTNSIYKQTLADGSIVWLEPKSKLEYPKKFTGTYRQVKMTGEAFFEVTKDHSHPFIIYSGHVITRVWGTSFRIRAYKNAPTEVSVITGKVSVKLSEKDNSEVMLLPKQKAVYNTGAHALKKASEVDASAMRIWQKTSVSFDNMPLNDVLNVLNGHFNMRIYTKDDDLGKYLLKADFTDQNLPAILDMLQNSLNVGYSINNNEIELYRKPLTN